MRFASHGGWNIGPADNSGAGAAHVGVAEPATSAAPAGKRRKVCTEPSTATVAAAVVASSSSPSSAAALRKSSGGGGEGEGESEGDTALSLATVDACFGGVGVSASASGAGDGYAIFREMKAEWRQASPSPSTHHTARSTRRAPHWQIGGRRRQW